VDGPYTLSPQRRWLARSLRSIKSERDVKGWAGKRESEGGKNARAKRKDRVVARYALFQ